MVSGQAHIAELTIVPGESIRALLRIERDGFDDLVNFDVENLPHGVIVDNIGLNGVLIVEGQTEREIFLSCGKEVNETSRLIHTRVSGHQRQVSLPVLLHVRKPVQSASRQ